MISYHMTRIYVFLVMCNYDVKRKRFYTILDDYYFDITRIYTQISLERNMEKSTTDLFMNELCELWGWVWKDVWLFQDSLQIAS